MGITGLTAVYVGEEIEMFFLFLGTENKLWKKIISLRTY